MIIIIICVFFPDTQWCIVDIAQLNGLLGEIRCPTCEATKLSFAREDGRYRFCYNITLSCSTCNVVAAHTYSSQRSTAQHSRQPFSVNDLIVLFFNQLGLGHTAMKKFSSLFGWEGLHLKTYQRKESKIINVIIDNTEDVLSASVARIKEAYSTLDSSVDTDPLCITVSFDGSWQKRGHTSMYGFASVIDVLTGLVVDYVILSKYCNGCNMKKTVLGEDSEEFKEWFQGHQPQCAINYTGTSNAMEVEAARRLWQRSEDRHGLRYTGFLSDGDSKAHKAVCDLDIYPEPILKEEFINHVHKRMGTALINLGKQKKLGGKGYGRLTKEKAIQFQHYYRWAIVNNVGDQDAMREAIWASLFHCVSTDESPQHDRCPSGPNSWCFYNKSIATDVEIPPHSTQIRHPLAASVVQEMVPVYERMSDANLLKRMEKGKTQNANECLHSVIWSRCPKTVFVGKHKLHGAAASAIAVFNEGAVQLSQVLRRLAVETNQIHNLLVEEVDSKRITKANLASSESVKKDRAEKWIKNRQQRATQEAAEGITYAAGGF